MRIAALVVAAACLLTGCAASTTTPRPVADGVYASIAKATVSNSAYPSSSVATAKPDGQVRFTRRFDQATGSRCAGHVCSDGPLAFLSAQLPAVRDGRTSYAGVVIVSFDYRTVGPGPFALAASITGHSVTNSATPARRTVGPSPRKAAATIEFRIAKLAPKVEYGLEIASDDTMRLAPDGTRTDLLFASHAVITLIATPA